MADLSFNTYIQGQSYDQLSVLQYAQETFTCHFADSQEKIE